MMQGPCSCFSRCHGVGGSRLAFRTPVLGSSLRHELHGLLNFCRGSGGRLRSDVSCGCKTSRVRFSSWRGGRACRDGERAAVDDEFVLQRAEFGHVIGPANTACPTGRCPTRRACHGIPGTCTAFQRLPEDMDSPARAGATGGRGTSAIFSCGRPWTSPSRAWCDSRRPWRDAGVRSGYGP